MHTANCRVASRRRCILGITALHPAPAIQVDDAVRRRAVSHRREHCAINAKWSFIDRNMTLRPPMNPDLNLVDYAVWGALQEMVYHCSSFKSVQGRKSAIVTARQSQAFLDQYQRIAASP